MAYGTATGVENNIVKYQDLRDYDGDPNFVALKADNRIKADAHINAKLAPVVAVPLSGLPSAIMDKINSISDDLTAYFILYPRFLKQEPNDTAFLEGLKERADGQLDEFVKNPAVLTADGADGNAGGLLDSNQEGFDRKFSVDETIDDDVINEGTQDTLW